MVELTLPVWNVYEFVFVLMFDSFELDRSSWLVVISDSIFVGCILIVEAKGSCKLLKVKKAIYLELKGYGIRNM